MWENLGRPAFDPHGSPIPTAEGVLLENDWVGLTQAPLNQMLRVKRIKNRSPEELRYLASLGLTTGTQLRVKQAAPLQGPLLIELVSDEVQALDYRLANAVMVSVRDE